MKDLTYNFYEFLAITWDKYLMIFLLFHLILLLLLTPLLPFLMLFVLLLLFLLLLLLVLLNQLIQQKTSIYMPTMSNLDSEPATTESQMRLTKVEIHVLKFTSYKVWVNV